MKKIATTALLGLMSVANLQAVEESTCDVRDIVPYKVGVITSRGFQVVGDANEANLSMALDMWDSFSGTLENDFSPKLEEERGSEFFHGIGLRMSGVDRWHTIEKSTVNADKLARTEVKDASYWYNKINNSGKWRYPKMDEKLRVESKYWTIKTIDHIGRGVIKGKYSYLEGQPVQSENPYSRDNRFFKLGDALVDLVESEAVIECRLANGVVSILSSFSIDQLNKYCVDNMRFIVSLGDMSDVYDLGDSSKLKIDSKPLLPGRRVEVGTFGYISSVENYFVFHQRGASAGFNVVCVGHNEKGQSLYTGFDPDGQLFTEPRTFEEVAEHLRNKLVEGINYKQIPSRVQEAVKMLAQIFREHPESFTKSILEEQKKHPSYRLRDDAFKTKISLMKDIPPLLSKGNILLWAPGDIKADGFISSLTKTNLMSVSSFTAADAYEPLFRSGNRHVRFRKSIQSTFMITTNMHTTAVSYRYK